MLLKEVPKGIEVIRIVRCWWQSPPSLPQLCNKKVVNLITLNVWKRPSEPCTVKDDVLNLIHSQRCPALSKTVIFIIFKLLKGAYVQIFSLTNRTWLSLESRAVYLMKIHTRLP